VIETHDHSEGRSNLDGLGEFGKWKNVKLDSTLVISEIGQSRRSGFHASSKKTLAKNNFFHFDQLCTVRPFVHLNEIG
jgi:hypothetical protein